MTSDTLDTRLESARRLVRHTRDVLQVLSARILITSGSTPSVARCLNDPTHCVPLAILSIHEQQCSLVSAGVRSPLLAHQTSSFFYEQTPHVVQLTSTSVPPSVPPTLLDPSLGYSSPPPPLDAYLIWHARQEILDWKHAPLKLGPWVGHVLLRASLLPTRSLTTNILQCHLALPLGAIPPISSLLRAILRAGAKEAFSPSPLSESLACQTAGNDCPVLFELLQWLASQLALFLDPAFCEQATLSLFRQMFLDPEPFLKHMDTPQNNDADWWAKGLQAALQELALTSVRMQAPKGPAEDRVTEHKALVDRAEAERQQRGSHYLNDSSDRTGYAGRQASGRKSSVEIAAEERDFKRRRVKYRSSANKRTPTQLLHDLIQEQMEALKEEVSQH